MPSRFGTTCISCGFLFIGTFALGHNQGARSPSRLTVSATAKDLNLVEANLSLLRDAYGYDKDGIGVPWVYLEPGTGRVKALAFVDGDVLEKRPVDALKAALMFSVAKTRHTTSTFVTELKSFPKVDIEMDFEGLASKRLTADAVSGSTQGGLEPYSFHAEYRNGVLTIRQKTSTLK